MKNNIRNKFINLLLLEINKFNKHKKIKEGVLLNIVINLF
jgi:hypothetical protein